MSLTAAPAPPPRMVLYLRVSTDEQASTGLGLDAQLHQLERAAEYEGWRVVQIIRDEGVSAKSVERDGLQHALLMLVRGEADGIAVAKLDRLTRSTRDFAELLDWLDEVGARLVALDLRLDTSTAMGRFAHGLIVIVLIAEWERGVISERTKAALESLRRAGRPTGRPAVVDDADLAERIRLMKHQEKLSLRAIATRLNEEGVPTMRDAEKWQPSAIQTVLGYKRPKRRPRPAVLPDTKRRVQADPT